MSDALRKQHIRVIDCAWKIHDDATDQLGELREAWTDQESRDAARHSALRALELIGTSLGRMADDELVAEADEDEDVEAAEGETSVD